MPVTASALVNAFRNDTYVTPFRVDHHASAQIKPHMRFIVYIRGTVSEQEVAGDQFIARNNAARRPKSIAVLSIVPNPRLAHESEKEARAVMCHEVGESCLLLAIAERDRASVLLIHRLNLCVG